MADGTFTRPVARPNEEGGRRDERLGRIEAALDLLVERLIVAGPRGITPAEGEAIRGALRPTPVATTRPGPPPAGPTVDPARPQEP